MAQSFTPSHPLSHPGAAPKRVLVTGAAGNIGSYFAEHSHARYSLRLMVQGSEEPEKVEKIRPFGEVVACDLSDLPGLTRLCDGVDTVLHLAGNASPSAVWTSVLGDNIVGTYHAFVAAKAAGCRRVVYASSIHAVSGYPDDVQVKTTDPVNPGDLYGVGKCFGEALARYMAEREGLPSVCLRIGAFQPLEAARKESSVSMLDAFVSHRDLNQLIEKSIDADHIRFAVFHGLSDNRFKRLDITDTRELLGYAPQDDLTAENPRLKPLDLKNKVGQHSNDDSTQKSGIREDLERAKAGKGE